MTAADRLAGDDEVAGVDATTFRRVFRLHAAGLAVVATGGAAPVGFTANSVSSVSLDPPLVSFNISRSASSWPAVARSEYLSIHLLRAQQHALATTFAASGVDKFAAVSAWTRGPYGLAVLDDVLAWMAGKVHTRIEVADHAVVVAQIVRASVRPGTPLVYHRGGYSGPAAYPE